MSGIIKRKCLLSLFHRTICGYQSLGEQNLGAPYDDGSKLAKRPHLYYVFASDQPQIEMMNLLLQGYSPIFKLYPLGWEAESLLLLSSV
ncbi:unnamed protein product [Penicillium olsonii]|nr:unnamed protein product [Penicillium olsonii]CAG7930685.1 unnamed protein product [Penicillium olsonii]